MNDSGFIKIHRTLWSSDDFDPEPFTQREAFLWLVSNAAWKPCKVRYGPHTYHLERGDYVSSIRRLGEQWGWHRNKVDRFLDSLVKRGVIKIGTPHKGGAGHITICNYCKYQDVRDTSGTPAGTGSGHLRDTSGTHKEESKKVRREEEDLEDKPIPIPFLERKGYFENCEYCGVHKSAMDQAFEADHFIPRSAGGSDDDENLVVACHVCNQAKSAMIFRDMEHARDWLQNAYWVSNRKRWVEHRSRAFGGCQPSAKNTQTYRGKNFNGLGGGDGTKRGSRLPADWRPDAECRAFADSLGVDADRTADEFRDYWASVPGAKGTKLDWPATWRNWCRRAAGASAQRPPRANGNQRGAASWSQACDNVLERIKGAADGGGDPKVAQDFEGKDDPPVGRGGGYGNSDLGLFGGIDEVSGGHSAPCTEGTAEEIKVVPFVVRTGRGT